MTSPKELYQCEGCSRVAKLVPVPKGKRRHYCGCNRYAPFPMTPVSVARVADRATDAMLRGLRK